MLDLRRFSDFLSGGAGGKQFDPAIKGFIGEPKIYLVIRVKNQLQILSLLMMI